MDRLKTILKPAILFERLMSYDELRDMCPPSSVTKSYDLQQAMESVITATGRSPVTVFVIHRGERYACVPELAYLAKTSQQAYYAVVLEYVEGLEELLAEALNKIWRIRVSPDVIRVNLQVQEQKKETPPEPVEQQPVQQPQLKPTHVDVFPLQEEGGREEVGAPANGAANGVSHETARKSLEDAVNVLMAYYTARDILDLAYVLTENPWLVRSLTQWKPEEIKAAFDFLAELKKAGLGAAARYLLADEEAVLAVVEKFHPNLYARLKQCLRRW